MGVSKNQRYLLRYVEFCLLSVDAYLRPLQAKMMVADIQAGFRELVEAATWMDNVTYTNAIKKLTDMIEIVGFPDIMAENMTAIDEEYKIASSEV